MNLSYSLLFKVILLIWLISIPFKNAVYQISTALIVLNFIIYLYIFKDYSSVKKILKKYKVLIFIMFGIFFIMVISNLYNQVNSESWKLTFYYFYRYGLIFFILIYFYLKDFFQKKTLIIFILISLGIQAIDGVYQSIFNYDIFNHTYGNIFTNGLSGATSNRNIFGFFMGIGFLLSLFCSKNFKIFYLFSLVYMFNVLFAYSRSIWVSLAISLLFYGILIIKSIDVKKIIVIIAFILLVLMIFFNIESLSNRFDQLLSLDSSNRTTIWLNSLPIIADNSIIGSGVNSGFLYQNQLEHYSVHNQTLEILLDLGIVGLIGFLSLLLVIIYEIYKFKDLYLGCILVYFLINSNFGESIISSKTMLSTLTVFMFFVFVNRLNLTKDHCK